jgi:hypothetical protein
MNLGYMEFQIELERKPLQVEEYEAISSNTRNLQFKCEKISDGSVDTELFQFENRKENHFMENGI